MKILKNPRTIIGLIASILLAGIHVQALAQTGPSMDGADREGSLRKALKSWNKSEFATSDKFIVAFSDLNGDGREEAVVYVIGSDVCGTGGCSTLVFVRGGASWRLVADISITRLPIRVLPYKSHGWHSIGVWVQGGGIYPGYEAELRFNGRTYPGDPTVPPAIRMKGVEGDVLIPDDEKAAKPLY